MKGAQKIQSKSCAARNQTSDNLNRMTSYRSNGSQDDNSLRIKKTVPGSTIKSTFYRYDGQMSIEEWELDEMTGASLSLTRNTLGARGIDMIQRVTASLNETSYPLYDAHGNMTGQLLKNGSNFTVGNEKSYDAWGGVRAGNSNPEYKGRYCANLGHVQDDESSLIYMRARYYEPSSGRFVSQDPSRDGINWFTYCNNNPITNVDQNGCESTKQIFMLGMVAAFWSLVTSAVMEMIISPHHTAPFSVVKGALKFITEILKAMIDVGAAKDLNPCKPDEWATKWQTKALKEVVPGMFVGALGAIMALKFGEHAGEILFHIFAIDFYI